MKEIGEHLIGYNKRRTGSSYDLSQGILFRGDNVVPLRISQRGWSSILAAQSHRSHLLKGDNLHQGRVEGFYAWGHVQSKWNVSDGLTKVLNRNDFASFKRLFGIGRTFRAVCLSTTGELDFFRTNIRVN